MELVYLWVEHYKNIHQQGFNFSPRFKCHYDDVQKELTIDENKEYVSIFPENINVTAIVGKNGSGKSSVLTGLTNHKVVVEKSNKFLSNDFNNSHLESLNREKDYEIIYTDFDFIKINPIRDWWDYSGYNIYDKNLYFKIENGIAGDDSFNIYKFRKNFFNLIIEHQQDFDSNLFFYNPSKIILSDYIHEINSKDARWVNVNKLIKDTKNDSLIKEKFLVFIYSNLRSRVIELPDVENIEDLTTHEIIFLEHAKYMEIGDNFQYLYDFFSSLIHLEDKNKISIEAFILIYNNHKEAFLKLIEIGYLQTNFKDDIDREYEDLSQGERKLFTEHLMIHHAIAKTEKEDIFVVLDEPDLTLHPDWQRKYLNETIRLLSTHESKNFHLIITSHSPFILSDLPKENVIFLEKGKQVYPFEDEKQTFGANIHTLLSHGFFMQDGLMGEFARCKINEAIDNLHGKLQSLSQKQIKSIIDSIGEPFLQIKLEQMYKEKFGLDDEIEELQKQQEEINLKIEQLKNQKSKNAKS
jgi:predicted ATP-dependent endonuclease of OLD family